MGTGTNRLADMYPDHAWEIVLGYDQEKLMSDRAAKGVVQGSIPLFKIPKEKNNLYGGVLL